MRYFLEVSYKGTNYSGFQTQVNANTIQSEVEKAFEIYLKSKINLTGSSRTDAGVHADQNFFHFDSDVELNTAIIYNLNAILPEDIVAKNLSLMPDDAHCRFDAISREYRYYIYQSKNPFLSDRAYYYPYKLDLELLNTAAEILKNYQDFTSFSKRNTQVRSFKCEIKNSHWSVENESIIFTVRANRFLRGMVRALTATMLKVGRSTISLTDFRTIIESMDCTNADFSAPAHGLFLRKVTYPENYFK